MVEATATTTIPPTVVMEIKPTTSLMTKVKTSFAVAGHVELGGNVHSTRIVVTTSSKVTATPSKAPTTPSKVTTKTIVIVGRGRGKFLLHIFFYFYEPFI